MNKNMIKNIPGLEGVKKGELYHADKGRVWTPYKDGGEIGILSSYTDTGDLEKGQFKRIDELAEYSSIPKQIPLIDEAQRVR